MTYSIAHIENVLIIGATGKTGSKVYDLLSNVLPSSQIKAASRSSEIEFDWTQLDTWLPALQGVSHVYLTYFPDLAAPTSEAHISRFCTLAKSLGVKHVTLLSGRGELAAQTCEDILINSGLSWTIIRASWFNQNFSDGFFKTFIDAGHIHLPVDSVREPFIDVNDIAEIGAQSILDTKHKNKLYEVTGPELLTLRDVAEKFSHVLGRAINFKTISEKEFSLTMSAAQVPQGIIELLNFLFTEVLDGRNEHLTNGVEEALGRKPTSFSEFIRANINEF
jgi:uncharacterized protein YbjT (DUF2867 family)